MPEGAEEATYYENLIVQRLEGGVGLIRINRPDRRNALNQATLKELAHAARGFDLDDTVGCLVITGDERAFAAGARGYVMKRYADDEILRAARIVRGGEVYLSAHAPLPGEPNGPLAGLTDREFEVFLLIGEGYAPRHIAEKLSLSVSTVEVYRERLKEKLGLESSPLLLRYAVRWCKDQDTV